MSDREPADPNKTAANIESKSNAVEIADDDQLECRACGYVYKPNKGDPKNGIIAGTPFTALPATWKCPTCGAKQAAFTNIGILGKASGFKENQKYGLGVNTMTAEQKNLLIFGSLGVGILILLSLYTLS